MANTVVFTHSRYGILRERMQKGGLHIIIADVVISGIGKALSVCYSAQNAILRAISQTEEKYEHNFREDHRCVQKLYDNSWVVDSECRWC